VTIGTLFGIEFISRDTEDVVALNANPMNKCAGRRGNG
jgi:hypothetical protein